MKVVIFFILTISLFAQDSVKVTMVFSEDNVVSGKSNNILIETKPVHASFLELKSNRIWQSKTRLELNPIVNRSSIVKFRTIEPSFIDSDLFLILVGTAVTFGATAAYFKLESDVAYDKYLESDKKSYRNKTDRYDLYSGIALGALEINFGFLIYKFLTD